MSIGKPNAEGAESAENAEKGLNELSERVIGAGIRVHREFGPGLLESTYEACLAFELQEAGLVVERQKALPVTYRGCRIEFGYRVDLLIEDALIVELKSVEQIRPVHEAQLLSYLRLSGIAIGLLINFNERTLKEGVRRVVNRFPESTPRTSRSLRSLR